ncbi:unnamed protein product [Paramecium primaurelia]|uniref:ZZ-type domain-containing protein n=1 Tax=Paramecium primaurelia TaxID=5886 RepID=A0A8S1P222_PARPR|nr:unnamed protein product [Paramecium primaurelia]
MKIKIVHNNEIHLFKQQNPNLQGIREHIKKIYPNINTNFTLAYNDSENDQISLSCQDDLQVLVDEGIQTIKVFVLTSNKPQQIPQGKMVHKRHTCDGCQIYPIVGSRFKCLECSDYDLCEECQAKDMHNHHKFYKISTQEELEQFRKEHWGKFGHWGHRGCGFNRNGPHGHGPHGHGPHGHGPFGHEAFKQFREFFQDPAFKEIKQTVCTIAKDVFGIIKTEIEKHKNSKQQEQTQEECNTNVNEETQQEIKQEIKQEIQQEIKQENTKESNDNKIQKEIEEKIKDLIQVLQCDEKIAREYIECFKELPLNEIVDIILEKQ